MRSGLTCVLLALLAAPGAAQQEKEEEPPRPKPRVISLYQPPPAKHGLVLSHAIIEGRYQVQLTLDSLMTANQSGDPQRPWKVYRFEAPEPGSFGKVSVRAGLLHDVKAKTVEQGFEIDLRHKAYRPPLANRIERAPLRGQKLIELSNGLFEGCFPSDRAAALARTFRAQLRSSRAAFARRVLHAFCLAYEDPPKAPRKQPVQVWQYLARLLQVEPKGDLNKKLYPRIRRAICGSMVVQTFRPKSAAEQNHKQASRVNARGEVGRAVLVGSLGDSNRIDWWRIELSDPAAPIEGQQLPAGMTWVRVREKGFRGCYLRVYGNAGGSYKLQVTNKSGPKYQWIEVHERSPAGKKLPY